MGTRTATPSTTAVATADARARARPNDLQEPADALAVLETLRRDSLLEAVAMAASELLRSSDLSMSLPNVAAEIGSATGVDRAHIFVVDSANSQGRILQHYLWTVPGLATPPEFRNPSLSMADAGLSSWISRLERGETITGHVRDFDPSARALFESGGVKSVLSVPIFADGQWKGLIGFDDCRNERDWLPAEVGTIKTLAELVGATIAARLHETILETVATSAKELLRSSDFQHSLPAVMERLGQVSGVDRVHIIEFDADDPSAQSPVTHHYVWTAPGVPESVDLRTLKNPMIEAGLGTWVPKLKRGEIIVGNARNFEPAARIFFDKCGVKSVLAVPIFVDDHWHGLIAFDACQAERYWGAAEIETFKTLAELVGGAVARIMHLRKLADTNRIVENSPTILYRLSPQPPFSLIYLSQNVQRYGYDAADLLAKPDRWLQLIESESHPTIAADITSIVEGRTEQMLVEFRLRKPDGSHAWFEGRGYAVRDEERRLVAIEGILTDITERMRAAEKIATLARTDSLTGLPNRAAFVERLNLEFARARRGDNQFALHYLDLDHFKDVNDTLGHPAGDGLLRAVADRLKSSVRETDLVARFGGDEFAVLQDHIADMTDVEALAGKIGAVIAGPFTIEGNQVHTSASIGIVPYRSNIAGVDAMLMKADLALYRAKNEGRNQFRFHVAELDEETRNRMILGEELRLAIEHDELELFYQPEVEIGSGCIVGLEALIRWNHPKKGLLLPAAFIPVAETTGTIAPIGEWVIERACQQIRAWNDQAIAPPIIGVNLSGAQFKLASQLDQVVAQNLVHYDVAPGQLELEITESVLIETTQRHADAFARLRNIGIRLAIDDFGTGYSSLDYLRLFHVSRLKIAPRFTGGVTNCADDAAIVRATIGLAHELGIEVVAEGVETVGQRDFLLTVGCTLAQGNFFGEPIPAAAVTELLGRRLQFAAI